MCGHRATYDQFRTATLTQLEVTVSRLKSVSNFVQYINLASHIFGTSLQWYLNIVLRGKWLQPKGEIDDRVASDFSVTLSRPNLPRQVWHHLSQIIRHINQITKSEVFMRNLCKSWKHRRLDVNALLNFEKHHYLKPLDLEDFEGVGCVEAVTRAGARSVFWICAGAGGGWAWFWSNFSLFRLLSLLQGWTRIDHGFSWFLSLFWGGLPAGILHLECLFQMAVSHCRGWGWASPSKRSTSPRCSSRSNNKQRVVNRRRDNQVTHSKRKEQRGVWCIPLLSCNIISSPCLLTPHVNNSTSQERPPSCNC